MTERPIKPPGDPDALQRSVLRLQELRERVALKVGAPTRTAESVTSDLGDAGVALVNLARRAREDGRKAVAAIDVALGILNVELKHVQNAHATWRFEYAAWLAAEG